MSANPVSLVIIGSFWHSLAQNKMTSIREWPNAYFPPEPTKGAMGAPARGLDVSAGRGPATEDVAMMANEIATLLIRSAELEQMRKRTLYRMKKALMDLQDYINRKNVRVDVVDDEQINGFRLVLKRGFFGIEDSESGVFTDMDYLNDDEVVAIYKSGRLVPFLRKIVESIAVAHDRLQEFADVVEAIERSLQEVDE